MLGRRRTVPVDAEALERQVLAVIEQDGLLAVTAERLAADLGTTPEQVRMLDLDAVVGRLYLQLATTEMAAVKREILTNPSPVAQMRALLTWLAEAPEEGDAIRLEAWALARRNPHLAAAIRTSETAWHGVVAGVIRRGARSGDFDDTEADHVAAHLITLVDGINAYEIFGYRTDVDRLGLITRVVQAELGLAWGPALESALR